VEHDSNRKGNVAELKIAAAATELGIPVLRPMTEHTRYDLVFELEGELVRVQCKWASVLDQVVRVHTRRSRYTPRGRIQRTYTVDEIDAVAAYCGKLDRCYLLPASLIAGKSMICLRLTAPRNGQRAALNWAADYELGAVAQLGRACGWQPQGRGFESHQLHSLDKDAESVTVGAHEFREHLGWHMERAAAGEGLLVTRRGKPYVKLSPAAEPLTVVPFPKKRLAAG
jgi:prevent-host-death family protein